MAMPSPKRPKGLTKQEIRNLRFDLGMTQEQIVAKLLESTGAAVDRSTWAKWEAGQRRPSQAMAVLLRQLQKHES